MSKKQERLRLEEELDQKNLSYTCPVCGEGMERGYVCSGYPVFWGERLNLLGGVTGKTKRLAGILARVNQLPSRMCKRCGIIISQFK